jgi:N-acetylmuramoyl-L-alanine amidase
MSWLERDWIVTNPENESPHSRVRRSPPTFIVLHYTAGGSATGSILWFKMRESNSSAHFVISRDGHITQCVPIDRAAEHVGKGQFGGSQNVNDLSIGIEMANAGLLIDDNGSFYYMEGTEKVLYRTDRYPIPMVGILRYPGQDVSPVKGYWEPYGEFQVEAAAKLCAELCKTYGIDPLKIVGHQDVCLPIGRKTDPGGLWDWGRFNRRLYKKLGKPVPEGNSNHRAVAGDDDA